MPTFFTNVESIWLIIVVVSAIVTIFTTRTLCRYLLEVQSCITCIRILAIDQLLVYFRSRNGHTSRQSDQFPVQASKFIPEPVKASLAS